jgi:molybdopterin/thiamine biosynthesis adenylyltransferase
MNINKEELEIFSRQLILEEFNFKNFKKLQNKSISIIGIGGIGCPTAQYLISSGIKNLQIFDQDIVKKSNLNRQNLFSINDIGKKKSIIAKKKLKGINPLANIKSYHKKISSDNLDLLKESSIVIDATDNWKTMKLVNNYCQSNSIPLLSSSVVGFDIQIALFVNNKKNHLCLECIFPNNNDMELARCETVGILGTAAGLAGLLSAQKTINFLMQFNQNNNFLTLINCKSLSFNHIKIDKNPKCNLILSKK